MKKGKQRLLGIPNGFTLVELLVILAIIAVVLGLVLSVIVHTRESSWSRTCLSNLKQLGTAFQIYLQDYDGTYPPAIRSYPDRSAWVAMPEPFIRLDRPARPEEGSLYPYVRNPEVYICPADPLGQRLRLSYAMNNKLGTYPDVTPNIRDSQIFNHSKTALLVEEPFNPHYHSTAFAPGGLRCFSPTQPLPCHPDRICGEPYFPCGCLGQLACRHGGKTTNVLFCDTHVQTYSPGKVQLGMFFPEI